MTLFQGGTKLPAWPKVSPIDGTQRKYAETYLLRALQQGCGVVARLGASHWNPSYVAGETGGGGAGEIFPSVPHEFHFLGETRGIQYIT